MCATMLRCAPVARSGLFFVSVDRSPVSHASRMTPEDRSEWHYFGSGRKASARGVSQPRADRWWTILDLNQ
jgi:hypothetical protein